VFSLCELGAFGVLAAGSGWLFVLAGSAIGLAVTVQLVVARWLGRPLLPALLAPVAWLVFVFAARRSMPAATRDGPA
jgi:hypothetical protein